jgi:branched-chain amino acid transport system substrate-binding protein
MKSRRLSMVSMLMLAMVIVLVVALVFGGCAKQAPAPATKTLKIGSVWDFGDPIGLDDLRGIQILAEADNKNGGLSIGGERYNVQLVEYDDQNNQTTEVAAINRLVFEDKVNFILTQGKFQAAWLKVTEDNKVMVLSTDPNAFVDLAPSTHYSFNPTFINSDIPSKTGWFCQNYPDKAKNVVAAFIDNQFGHMIAGFSSGQFKAFGVTPTVIFYPPDVQDLSAVATKIISLNPTAVMCLSGQFSKDGLVINAVYQAGYRGQHFAPTNYPAATLLAMCSPEVLEGFITGMYPTEVDPALTTTGQQFKELWIAKYGKWEDPQTLGTAEYYCLRAALEKAGTPDVDKVSEVIASGLEYSSANGDGKMISRPDLGNNRTVDSVATFYVKRIHNGKTELLATISIDEAFNYLQKTLSAPPAGPPPGGEAPPGAPPGPPAP